MIKKLTNKKIVLISATVIVVVLILGFTLALWSSNFTQTGTNTIASDCFNIEYSESDATSLVKAYPQTDEDGLKNVSYDVTIENTCNTIATYNVLLNELSSNTLAESHVKVSVNDSYKMLNTYEIATPSADVDNASSARLLTQGVLGPQQERTIGVKSWMDEDTTELEGENKTFGYKITIEASTTPNDSLASKILSTNNMKSTSPTTTAFANGEPTKSTGVSGATYKELTDNDTTLLTSDNNKTIGSGYTFNKTTGKYTLTNTTDNVSYDTSLIGYYTCNDATNENCTTMYKINAVDGTSITSSTKYTQRGTISGSGIFSTQDDDGTSFYLRGEINNNYVSFANKLWRVIRINGDGSIRMILNDSAGNSKFNNSQSDFKYLGYTYDNNRLCTKNNPCNGSEGTSSDVKNFVDDWYTNNLANYDSKIAYSLYCNDTTYNASGSYHSYGANHRGSNPSLQCQDTQVNYGGSYKLKIGLISSDELIMAGKAYLVENYLYFSTNFWTGSPKDAVLNKLLLVSAKGRENYCENVNVPCSIRPVISLLSDVIVSSGNGTYESPYIIANN